jgi:hypothetical protein
MSVHVSLLEKGENERDVREREKSQVVEASYLSQFAPRGK